MLSREIYGTNKEAMLLPINGHINDLGWKGLEAPIKI